MGESIESCSYGFTGDDLRGLKYEKDMNLYGYNIPIEKIYIFL